MKSGAARNGARGARKLPMDTIREALGDPRAWVKLGIVTKFEGETSHYELDGQDLLVDVELMPERIPVLCRMGSPVGGQYFGVWSVPPVGTEVMVVVPDGDLEADPVIVSCLSTGQLPQGAATLDEQTIVISGNGIKIVGGATIQVQSDTVVIIDADEEVQLGGATGVNQGVVNGECVDSFTGTPYAALHSLTGKVKAPK